MTDAAKRQKIAQLVLDFMYPRDHNAHAMGITITEIRPGYAKARMVVRKEMLNGHGSLHGGNSFALADTAFAYACNSYNTNAVAAGFDLKSIARMGVDILVMGGTKAGSTPTEAVVFLNPDHARRLDARLLTGTDHHFGAGRQRRCRHGKADTGSAADHHDFRAAQFPHLQIPPMI